MNERFFEFKQWLGKHGGSKRLTAGIEETTFRTLAENKSQLADFSQEQVEAIGSIALSISVEIAFTLLDEYDAWIQSRKP